MLSSQADAIVTDWNDSESNDKKYLFLLVIYAWDDEH